MIYEEKAILSGIYKITNLINNKVYIGQSKNIYKRWYMEQHSKTHVNIHLYNSFKKYGIDKFKFEVVYETYDLNKWEKFFIFWNQSNIIGYNMTKGGEGGGVIGFKFTEDSKNKMRKTKNDPNYIKYITNKLRTEYPYGKKVICIETGAIYRSIRAAEREINGGGGLALALKHGWKYKGYTWEYIDKKYNNQLLKTTCCKPVKCIETEKIFKSITEAAKYYNITPRPIMKACQEGRISCGYHWEYLGDEAWKKIG
jgi:group I intron endonuclease